MLHQFDVAAVISPEIVEAVRELLPVREQLLEIAEAAGQGVAARIDDLGVRQDQLDEPQVLEVIRHLVDEEGLAGLALDAGVGEVLLAERPAVPGAQIGQRLGVDARGRHAPSGPPAGMPWR